MINVFINRGYLVANIKRINKSDFREPFKTICVFYYINKNADDAIRYNCGRYFNCKAC